MKEEQRNSHENVVRLFPVMEKAKRLGKEGRHEDAYQLMVPFFQAKEVPTCYETAAGWVVYNYLKLCGDSPGSVKTRRALAYYFSFSSCRPSLVHSVIMRQAVKLEKNHENDFQFIEFCRMWNLEHFREEDFKRMEVKSKEGKIILFSSLAEEVATRLYKEMKLRHTEDFARQLLPFFENVESVCRWNKFIPMYKAQMLLWAGEKNKAIVAYKHMLVGTPDWYLWKNLAELMEDEKVRVACLCKALLMQHKDEYVGDVRLELAKLTLEETPELAAFEVERYFDTYTRNKWNIEGEVYMLRNRLKGVMPIQNPMPFYRMQAMMAEAFVFGDVGEKKFVITAFSKDHKGRDKVELTNMENPHFKLSVLKRFFPVLKNARKGENFLVRVKRENKRNRVLTIRRMDADTQ